MIDIETIAAAIHETYRALSRSEGWSLRSGLDRPYAELDEADKEDNRAAVRRMTDVLAAGHLALSDDAAAPEVPEAALAAKLEQMAEAEHIGWMAHRSDDGWRWGEQRDDEAKRHPSMRPYALLSEEEKDKDRNNVRHYKDFAAHAGYHITWLPQGST